MSPDIFNISEIQTYTRGDTVTLNCLVRGGPFLDYQWQFGGMDVAGGNDSFLYLSNIDASHGGDYTCVASNGAGNDTASTSVFISPYFITQPQEVFTSNGSNISIVCEAESFPSPIYNWARSDMQAIRNQVTGRTSTVLTFDPLQFGDEGNYSCNVTSQGITITSTTSVVTGNTAIIHIHHYSHTYCIHTISDI